MGVEEFDGRGSSSAQGPLLRFRCSKCSYGASRSAAPERCPMCGGSTWEHESWRPFTSLVPDLLPTDGERSTASP
jgi:hypothetical protein